MSNLTRLLREKSLGGLQIQIASDLHLEMLNGKKVERFFEFVNPSAPYLALVGDICSFNDPYTLKALFEAVSMAFEKVLYVPGNHEYYVSKGKPWKTKEKLLARARELAKGTNVTILDNESVVLDGVRVIGSTLWSNVPRIHYNFIENYLNDYRSIYRATEEGQQKLITCEDTVQYHKQAVQYLTQQLFQAYRNKEPVLVLTHHAPSFRNTSAQQYQGKIGTLGFATDLTHLFGSHVSTWVFGHTHWCCDNNEKGTRVISNAKGYTSGFFAEKYKKGHEYKEDLVITVPRVCLKSMTNPSETTHSRTPSCSSKRR